MQQSQQTFFLPRQHSCQTSIMPADCYNLIHTLLKRSASEYVFIPIRSMQYLAVIEGFDIWFVDSQAYAVSDNEGGRMITVSWHSERATESLQENIPMKVIFYDQDMNDIQMRMCAEFRNALHLLDQRYREGNIPNEGARILPLSSPR